MELIKRISLLQELNVKLHRKDFLLTWEKSYDELVTVLEVAEILREMREQNISPRIFDSGLGVSIFRDNSTRTRFSYASACNLLGCAVQDMDEQKSQIAHGETVRETAQMISFLTEFIGIRDDMYLGEGNKYMRQVAASLDEGYENGILPNRPAVVNLQCDLDHPTQSMADLLHLINHFGSIEKLKGKKITMSWAHSPSYGKPLSVPQGVIALMSRFGMDITLAHPEGYDLIPEIVELSKKNAAESGGSFKMTNSMEESMVDADIVYPKSWAPYTIMQQRTTLLQNADKQGLVELEKQCLIENSKHIDWEYNEKMANLTKNQNALYMHCLPADISDVSCKNGEVAADTFEKYRLDTYHQAGYKPYIIASMLMTTRFEKPLQILSDLIFSANQRVKE
ncbi:MAG: knotted carbamoyltransferase YgeW [Salinivirgaceae bacterium]|nr:knotted carbamoyltransferase YgeW [Salinivirgaceae bacterium]MDY0279711.1 knotted carbamoyltransferase YgeW [Salinivirgaceae bacterium]